MVAHRALRGLFTATVVLAATTTLSIVHATPAPALSPVNPVRVDVDGHPANSGFLVFVEGDTALNADESEGTLATGGDLSFNSTYNVAAHSPKDSTFTAPGDSQPTLLYVGGGVAWTGSQVLRVLNSGYTKIADSATYTARNTDQNGAKVNINIVKPGAVYGSTPRIEGTTSQPPASVATPVPSGLISIPGAFTKYRSLTTEIADCPQTVRLTDPNGGSTPIDQPYTRGARGRLTLETGTTNVLTMSTADLANLSEITFTNQPTASTPLVVNVTGSAFNGNIPNLAGIGGSQAPYILWNFPQATSIVVTGGASIEGTIYAPNAALNWRPTQNVEGNIIAASFTHGPSSLARKGQVREIHDFPFATTISCSASHPTGTLTLVKHVDNSGGGTGVASDWTLSADGPQTVTGPGNSADVTSVTVDTGIYELTESGGLANYTSGSWSCTGGLLVGHFVTVTKNPEVTCEITNSYHPPPPPTGALTLIKHVDNTGGGIAGPSDWTLTASGPDIVTGAGNSDAVTDVTTPAGDYDLSESGGPSDYTSGTWSCAGGDLTGSTVTITDGSNVTCEITNTYHAPPPPTGTLTLVKHVDNSGGGTATAGEWTLTAAGPDSIHGAAGSDAVTGVAVGAGDYDLSESGGPDNYTPGSWSCTGGTLTGNTVTVTDGADVTCQITNTYHPPPPPTGTLTLIKHVDGGLATPDLWTLTADGPQTVTGPGNSALVTAVVVATGDYDLSESGGPAHYAAGDWTCTGGTLTGTTVTVTDGADVTCQITNTYHPPPPPTGTLTLVKHVDNTGGGQGTPDEWTLTADGPQTVTGPGNTPSVTAVVVASGDYALTESGGPADYDASDWTCTGGTLAGDTVTVTDGADVTCEITNTYHPPPSPPAGSITLVKHVKGGTGVPSDWTLSAAGPQTVRGPANSEAVTGIVVPIGSYTLTESGGPTGYKASKWTCNGKALSGDSVRVKRNALVTCEITNTSGHSQVEPGGATGHPPGSSTSGLAFTGANIATMIAGALACFTLGGILVLATRRRGPRLPAALTDEELS